MEEWNSQANTLYKLMILYMLQKVEYTLSFTRLSDFVLGRGYTSWFTLHASAAELQEGDDVAQCQDCEAGDGQVLDAQRHQDRAQDGRQQKQSALDAHRRAESRPECHAPPDQIYNTATCE